MLSIMISLSAKVCSADRETVGCLGKGGKFVRYHPGMMGTNHLAYENYKGATIFEHASISSLSGKVCQRKHRGLDKSWR